jgi:hypothetical protein
MNILKLAALATAAAVASPSIASAQATAAGFDGTSLPACDDCFSDAQALGFSANFFGNTYTDTYVSNNGYVTFGAGQGAYSPQGLGAGYVGLPIIAALFTDLDTRSSPVGSLVSFGTGAFQGRNAFGINYDNVGQYSANYNGVNTFQILLVDRNETGAGNFDIVFNYDSLGFGRSASAGYNAGQNGADGTYFELPGSRSGEDFANGGAFALASGSNVGIDGRYVFNVRNGAVTPGGSDVPEPATWALMILGFGAVGGAMRRRRAATTTVRFA